MPIDGTEQVILGDLSILAEGEPVEVAAATGEAKAEAATAATGTSDTHVSDVARAPLNRLAWALVSLTLIWAHAITLK